MRKIKVTLRANAFFKQIIQHSELHPEVNIQS
ncbi:hypothetical protein T06_6474 [Trichinella sp. T6]|nr:hypothetical protein T06_6474 [Trichinella sp. T6]